MKRYSTTLVIREMPIKSTTSYYYLTKHIQTAKAKIRNNNKETLILLRVDNGAQELSSYLLLVEMQNGASVLKNSLAFSHKVEYILLAIPIPLSCICPSEIKTCTWMCTTALFFITPQ